jgi:hypothetical protein
MSTGTLSFSAFLKESLAKNFKLGHCHAAEQQSAFGEHRSPQNLKFFLILSPRFLERKLGKELQTGALPCR